MVEGRRKQIGARSGRGRDRLFPHICITDNIGGKITGQPSAVNCQLSAVSGAVAARSAWRRARRRARPARVGRSASRRGRPPAARPPAAGAWTTSSCTSRPTTARWPATAACLRPHRPFVTSLHHFVIYLFIYI